MAASQGGARPRPEPRREFPFEPRIINPVKIRDVVVLAGTGPIRSAARFVQPELPWVRFEIPPGPSAIAALRPGVPTVLLVDDVAANLVDLAALGGENPDLVVVLLSAYPLIQCSPPSIARREYPYTAAADLVFAVNDTDCAPRRILKSVVRCAEDHLNVARRPEARRFIFLLVDDEPRWFSEFLPVLYEIIGQRADVKLTRTYEEAVGFLFGTGEAAGERGDPAGHGDDVVCLITDIYFPRGDAVDAGAGRDLVLLVKERYPRIPIIIASKAAEGAGLGAGFVLPKGDPGSLALLRSYVRDLTGIGDFVVYGDEGGELHRVKDIAGLYRLIVAAGGDDPGAAGLRRILSRYAEQDRFSTWLYMHGFRELGDRLRPERLTGRPLVRALRKHLKRELLRMPLTPLVVDGIAIHSLDDLAAGLRAAAFQHLESVSDNDAISGWLDQRGYAELADELRPIHGRGADLRRQVGEIVEKWARIYRDRPPGIEP